MRAGDSPPFWLRETEPGAAQGRVLAARDHELVEGSLLRDAVGIADGGEPVDDYELSTTWGNGQHPPADALLCHNIDGVGDFVEERRIPKDARAMAMCCPPWQRVASLWPRGASQPFGRRWIKASAPTASAAA